MAISLHASRLSSRPSFSANATLSLLRRFEPMRGLDWHTLSSLAKHAQELSVPSGRLLLRPPRRVRGVWYLISGVLVDEMAGIRFRAGSQRCRLPVHPGASSLRAETSARLLFFDPVCLPMLLPELAQKNLPGATGLPGRFESSPFAKSGLWLEKLAASPLLRMLYQRRGAAGWQSWLRALQSLPIARNQVLINPGEVGDYFYVVQQGVAVVRCQQQGALKQDAALSAHIRSGGFFGEDALLSGQRRNARVDMPFGGRVLRGSAMQLAELVDDIWWVLARQPESWRTDNQPLNLPATLTTSILRSQLERLSAQQRYALMCGSNSPLCDLVLLLLVHRGYSVGLREGDAGSGG